MAQDNESSDEDYGEITFEFDDFEPFMASFRCYRMHMSETEKQDSLNNLRANGHMKRIIENMFDFDVEVVELEKELLSVKEKMEPMFNFIDLSVQLFSGPIDDNVAALFKQMNRLRRYYDSKATLNIHNSENIIDIFRFCIRKNSAF